eukprot:1158543-Pelagomonas_calceolata.AAC.3
MYTPCVLSRTAPSAAAPSPAYASAPPAAAAPSPPSHCCCVGLRCCHCGAASHAGLCLPASSR